MNLQPIALAAAGNDWRLFMVRKADPAFRAFQEKVFQRDQYMCRYCGYSSKASLEVINLDGNYRNNRLANLVTACDFCAQCFFLEGCGRGDFAGGVLIHLPEISQNELNALCHVLFTSMLNATDSATQARNIYRGLRLRSQVIEKELGEGMSQPNLLGRLLIDVEQDAAKQLQQRLASTLRLLPDFGKFARQVAVNTLAALQQFTFKD